MVSRNATVCLTCNLTFVQWICSQATQIMIVATRTTTKLFVWTAAMTTTRNRGRQPLNLRHLRKARLSRIVAQSRRRQQLQQSALLLRTPHFQSRAMRSGRRLRVFKELSTAAPHRSRHIRAATSNCVSRAFRCATTCTLRHRALLQSTVSACSCIGTLEAWASLETRSAFVSGMVR